MDRVRLRHDPALRRQRHAGRDVDDGRGDVQRRPADNAYCMALESGQKELESISSKISDTAALEQGKAVLVKIEAAAPAGVKQAWGDFIAFVDAAASGDTSALSAATAKMEASGATIEQHAKQTCNLDIS